MKVHITIKSQLNPTSASMDTNYKKNYVRGGLVLQGIHVKRKRGRNAAIALILLNLMCFSFYYHLFLYYQSAFLFPTKMGTPLCPTCVVNCHSSLLLAFVRSALLTLGCLQFERSCNDEFSGELGQLGSELILYLSVCLCRPKMNELAFVQQPASQPLWGQGGKHTSRRFGN